MDNQLLTIRQVLDLLNQGIVELNNDVITIDNKFNSIFVFANAVSGFPVTGDANHLYIDTTNNIVYYWNVDNNSYQSTKGAGADIPLADATHNGLFSSVDFVKLSGISAGANKVAVSTTNGGILIDGVEKTVFDYTQIPNASTIASGLMNPAMVTKLDGIAVEATKTQKSNTVGNIVINGTETKVFNKSDIPLASTTEAGLMTALNVTKLNGIAEGATKTQKSAINGNILINGEEVTVFTGGGGGDIPLASATIDGLQSKENFVKQSTQATGATKTEASNVNGNILINDAEVTVFDYAQIPLADGVNKGLMSNSNYTKLTNIAPEATKVEMSKTPGNIVINGTESHVFNTLDIPDASTTKKGLMTTQSVTKLSGIADNATKVESSTTNGNVIINGIQTKVFDATKIPDASATVKGYFTPSGFNKLEGISAEANKTSASTVNGNILIDGIETKVYTPSSTGEGVIAEKLGTPRAFSLTGDVNADPINFDGTGNVVLTTALKTLTGIGTGVKPTVNNKGLVTNLDPLAVSDIPDLPNTKVTGLGTASTKDVGTQSGNVVMLGADGLINVALLPPMAITKVYEANSEAAMLALKASAGSVCVRTDVPETFILREEPATTLANWVQLPHPSDAVTSVNGQIGAVNLTSSNITEGTNLYFTTARASANFNTNIAKTASTALSDGATLVHTSDVASATENGLMSSANFTKLEGISTGATKVTDSATVGNIVIDGNEVSVFSVTDIPDASTTVKGLMVPAQTTKLNSIATGATKVASSATAGHIMINDVDTAVFEVSDIPDASTTVKGLMGTAMVSKLNGIAEGATKVETSSTVGNIKINGTETKVFNVSDIPVASSSTNGLLTSAKSDFIELASGFYSTKTGTPTVLHVNTRSNATSNSIGSIYQPFTSIASAVAYATAESLTGYSIVVDDANVVADTEFGTPTNCATIIVNNAPVNITQATFNLGNTKLIANIVNVTNANCTIKSEIKAFRMAVNGSIILGEGGNIFIDEFVGAQGTVFTVGVAAETNAPFINILQGQNIDWGAQITLVKQPSLGSRIGYLYYGLTAQA